MFATRQSRWQRVGHRPVRFALKVVIVALFLGWVMTQVVLGTAGEQGTTVVVQPGQTLWAIVCRHYPQTDPRDAVGAVEAANHLDGPVLSPGEHLLLPPV
ncbi:MAG: hypothetical protein ACREOL_02705 [Candidatus Dormibacteria bacterium]